MYNIKKPIPNLVNMNSHIIELDDSDEMLIYQQNIKQKHRQNLLNFRQDQIITSHKMTQKQIQLSAHQMIEKRRKDQLDIPSKSFIRSQLLKYLDRIHQLYIEQKTPTQIQMILKEPTLIQIKCFLKQKIQTFLNIIFESSHQFTEQQAQKIRPQVDQKILKISTQMLNPYQNNFIDPVRYKNFLKLMKYHKQGRRSEKINKKCFTFYRLFFIKMKFEGISHIEGNVIESKESKSKNPKSVLNEKEISEQSNSQQEKSKKIKKSSKKDQLYGAKNSKKKYFYGKQKVVNQKMMDNARQQLLKQIKIKLTQLQKQKQDPKIPNKNQSEKDSFQKKSQISSNKSNIQILEQYNTFQWTFDKQNSLLFILFESHRKKMKCSKMMKHINEKFSKKYERISKQHFGMLQIKQKLQSMFSISCQKFIRRIKYLTIKQGLQNNSHFNVNADRKQNQTVKPLKNKKIYSIISLQKKIQLENDRKNLTKQDQFYFIQLKQHLKALQVKQVFLSSAIDSPCQQEWTFVLEFIREFYFSVLEDFKFDYLLQYAKTVIQMKTIERNLGKIPIPIQDQDSQQEIQQQKKKRDDCQKDMLKKLPKSSICLTLSKIGKSKSKKTTQQLNVKENLCNQIQDKELQFISIDQILKKSINLNVENKKTNSIDSNSIKNKTVEIQSRDYVKFQDSDQYRDKNLKQFKRGLPITSKEKIVQKQRNQQNVRKENLFGEPMKKIKQNEVNQNINPLTPTRQSVSNKQQHLRFQSDDQFEEIIELNSSIEQEALQQESTKIHEKSLRYFNSQVEEKQDSLEEERQTAKKTISILHRGPRFTQEEKETIDSDQIERLIQQMQEQENPNQQDDKSLYSDLPTIHQQEGEDGSQNISNSGKRLKDSSAFSEQDSVYELDSFNQINSTGCKLYSNQKQNNSLSKINKINTQQQNQIKESDPSLSLQLIRKELLKIITVKKPKSLSQQKQYSSQKLINSKNDQNPKKFNEFNK